MEKRLLKLGIDTGGTYTDAVLVAGERTIVAAAKCLTTRHDLTLGIDNALDALPQETLREVSLVALSTTLSTNSVVEGYGAPVGVLLPGYGKKQVEKSGLLEIFESELVATLPGGHDALGRERELLDENRAAQLIETLQSRVAAFAVSSMFGVRNPAHEIRLREMISELCARPVTCGHELANDLDAPRRALTVALNARMVPVIHELIKAVQNILDRRGIDAPLMMVKGNGSLINTRTALKQPVGTVLSGPAASVIGACALSGAGNAIIADMGGTTTDIAVVTNGHPELSTDGVRIGAWKPMVEAVRVISLGLGGDSEVRFSGQAGIEIGPRRVVPLSLLGHLYPELVERLRKQLAGSPGRSNNRFALRLEHSEVQLARCGTEELRAWELLADAPLEIDALVQCDKQAARAVARLQRRGLVIFSGFTPSDAAHVLGMSEHWCRESAELAARIWARQMRQVYGLGRWQENDAAAPSEEVFECVTQRICQALIEAGLHQHRRLDSSEAHSLTGLLAELVLESAAAPTTGLESGSLFHLRFAADYPLVAVGAPARSFFPVAAKRLGMQLTVPERAEVANAFGAVLGSVVQRAQVTVTQPLHGRFVVHAETGPENFSDLDEAVALARRLATAKVRRLAGDAGAAAVEIRLHSERNHVDHDLDGELFLETTIIATASGRPDLGALSKKPRA
ncbi:MAG: hydantoinase/oxoprolinase family protein [Xanthomonadales bacterium]|nr:hydantoinase/oxoprolinase family protein [Xanthomonadales bacterium]